MKGNLRKIVIDQIEYVYRVSDKYDGETRLNTLTVKVYVNGKKRTPLIIRFLTMEHYYAGQPLKSGINLFHKPSNTEVSVNLNEPRFIRELIEFALKKGWNGQVQMEIKNGLDWLNELGYDVNELIEEAERILAKTMRLKKLGYTESWTTCGLLTMEQLAEQERIFAEGEDQNTEHYRYAACVHYLKTKKELSDLEFERYFMILKEDPNTYMAGSAILEVFKWIRLTDNQFELFSKRAIDFGDWIKKPILREKLLHQLKTKPHTPEFIGECIIAGDSTVQNYLIENVDLNQQQWQELSTHGKNKRIRTEAKTHILDV
jgi:hypothetical protein